jgi:hypothetical protein
MDHLRTLPGGRRPYCTRRRHVCPRALAMEYDRILRRIERTSDLRSCASRAGGLETVPAPSKISIEERTRRIVVNRSAFRGRP